MPLWQEKLKDPSVTLSNSFRYEIPKILNWAQIMMETEFGLVTGPKSSENISNFNKTRPLIDIMLNSDANKQYLQELQNSKIYQHLPLRNQNLLPTTIH